MRGARAKALRHAALHASDDGDPRLGPRTLYRRFKREWPWRNRSPVREPSRPRRSMTEKQDAAVARGAAERAERESLRRIDEWLFAQPWMSIQRLRRVVAARRAIR